MRFGSFDVERRTQEIGRDLFRRVRDARVPFSLNRWLDERFMSIAMRDEAVKAQLFRLVDTMPVLTSSSDAANLAKMPSYFGIFFEQLKTSKARTPTPVYSKMETIFSDDGVAIPHRLNQRILCPAVIDLPSGNDCPITTLVITVFEDPY